ncbi:MAG TPA: response regulator [Thermoanaerobaculia bacterium]
MSETLALLIVEDDLSTRTLLEAVARRNRFQPTVCGDGRAALHHLDGNEFAVILLDLRLPELDGFAVLEQLGSRSPRLLERVIVVTAVAQARLRTCAQLGKVWHVMRKPFELRALEEQIHACSAHSLGH